MELFVIEIKNLNKGKRHPKFIGSLKTYRWYYHSVVEEFVEQD